MSQGIVGVLRDGNDPGWTGSSRATSGFWTSIECCGIKEGREGGEGVRVIIQPGLSGWW